MVGEDRLTAPSDDAAENRSGAVPLLELLL